jgi:hypothetical protein
MKNAFDDATLQSLKGYQRQQDTLKMMGLDSLALRRHEEYRSVIDSFAALGRIDREELKRALNVRIEGMHGFSDSAIFDAAKSASRSAAKMLAEIAQSEGFAAQISSLSKDWAELARGAQPNVFKAIVDAHFGQIAQTVLLAQSSVAGLRPEDLGGLVRAAKGARERFAAESTRFSVSYGDLIGSLARSHESYFILPPVLTDLPAVEFFNGADLLSVTTPHESGGEDDYGEEKAAVREEIREETQDALGRLLLEFNPALVPLRDGARRALASENPDRVRHFAVSYRELFTHVLHALAPDEEVRAWSSAKEHYVSDRPTRKARMLYACRRINQRPFDNFVTKDIDAALAVLGFFQQGTHEVESSYTPAQIAALEVRMEGTVRFLLEINRAEV